MKKLIILVLLSVSLLFLCGCSVMGDSTGQNIRDTKLVTENLLAEQQTPTDIDFSLERYNLIKRAYWVNGQREKAMTVPCNVERPVGYIVLLADSGAILRIATVDGKVSSLNSYLSPDSEYYEYSGGNYSTYNYWLADVDGSYGENVDGIFWFDVDGHYWEWTGTYLYSDIPFNVDTPILSVGEVEK